MNREAYLQELWGRLSNRMPRRELENTMRYYEEYFNEAGPEREAAVMEELGTPEALARQIVGDWSDKGGSFHKNVPPPRRDTWSGGKIALVVCLSPIWLSLLIAVFAMVAALLVAAFSLVIGLVAGGIGCVAGGAFLAWCGFTAIFSAGFPTLIFFGGMGLFTAGIGILMAVGGIALGGLFCKGFGAMFRGMFRSKRREALA